MNAWIIYNRFEAEQNKHYIQLYVEHCHKRQVNLRLLLAENITTAIENNCCVLFYDTVKQNRPDFVICRVVDPFLTKQLELMGIAVFNNHHVSTICNDKRQTHQVVSGANINMMDTIFADKHFSGALKFPVVVKPSDGKGGNHVYLVHDTEGFNRAVAAMPTPNWLIQKVADQLGKDLRVYVIGQKIVAAMLRVSHTDFRSNYCLGGDAQLYHLSPEQTRMVKRIIKLFDFGLVGIDFVFDKGQLVFNEIEDVVGARMLFAKTNINIVADYVDFILETC